MRYLTGFICDRGLGPERGGRAANEDNFLLGHEGRTRHLHNNELVDEGGDAVEPGALLAAVADGMGGHEHGAVASAAAAQALARLYRQGLGPDPEVSLHGWILRAHRRLRARARERGAANMGTTLTVLWLHGREAVWAHVGDSRLYLLRNGQLGVLTKDHTRGEFASRDGRPLPVDARALTQNFIYGSRGFGADEELRIDAGQDTGTLALLPGDRLLLASDGLHGFVSAEAIAERLSRAPTAQAAAQALFEAALAADGNDNITAVVIEVAAPL
jgi:protein phosphatase